MTITILKVLLVLVILSAMIILLVTINHYLVHSFESDDDDMVELRQDIEKNDKVITRKSSFSNLVEVKNQENPHNTPKKI